MCECCKDINMLQSLTRPDYNYEYTARIARDSYKNKLFRGTVLTERHKMNFCPTCGRNLKEE